MGWHYDSRFTRTSFFRRPRERSRSFFLNIYFFFEYFFIFKKPETYILLEKNTFTACSCINTHVHMHEWQRTRTPTGFTRANADGGPRAKIPACTACLNTGGAAQPMGGHNGHHAGWVCYQFNVASPHAPRELLYHHNNHTWLRDA